MDSSEKKIEEIIKQSVEENNFLLIDIVFRGSERDKVIEIYIDAEKNVTAEDCASISREISKKIENASLIKSSYRLDVSSPGVDRPVKFLKQFPKHTNRNFEIVFEDEGKIKTIKGKLKSIDGDDLLFIINKDEEIRININKINTAKVIISFS
jgi:ribosome maturation factor RimP